MKTRILIALLLLGSLTYSQVKEFRKHENNAFTVGEKLVFDVKYGFVVAGTAYVEIPEIKRISGRDTYKIQFKVNSVPTFDSFYKVRDRYLSYVDVESLFPWRFEQHIREGGYTRDFAAFFDHRKGKAKTSEGTYDIPENVNDIVSAFYFFRTLDFDSAKVGDRYFLENFYKDRVYPLDVVYLGKETVKVEAGTFECIMVEPMVREGGLFKSEGTIVIWLTDDEARMPIKMRSKIVIGSIEAELTSYKGVKGALTSKRD